VASQRSSKSTGAAYNRKNRKESVVVASNKNSQCVLINVNCLSCLASLLCVCGNATVYDSSDGSATVYAVNMSSRNFTMRPFFVLKLDSQAKAKCPAVKHSGIRWAYE